jgi:2-keto-3-deoxy-galactonokinase
VDSADLQIDSFVGTTLARVPLMRKSCNIDSRSGAKGWLTAASSGVSAPLTDTLNAKGKSLDRNCCTNVCTTVRARLCDLPAIY